MTEPVTHELEVPGAVLRYDVRESEPAGGPVLVMIGSPMGAAGFATLATYFTDRTIVTYDPRGVERSERTDPDLEVTPEVHAADVRAVIEAVGGGPVDLFASSGGAVNALALVAAHPEPRADARRPRAAGGERAAGRGGRPRRLPRRPRHLPPTRMGRRDGALHRAGLAARSGAGRLRGAAAARPGDVRHADGGRRRPRRPDARLEHLDRHPLPPRRRRAARRARRASSWRSVPARTVSSPTAAREAVAELLGTSPVTFPGDHGGFLGGEYGQTGEPEAFAARLREVLANGK